MKERGLYKGFVLSIFLYEDHRLIVALLQIRDVLPGDIYLKELFPSDCLYPPDNMFSDYNADVDGSNAPKIVRVYRHPQDHGNINEQDSMKVSRVNSALSLMLRYPLAIPYNH